MPGTRPPPSARHRPPLLPCLRSPEAPTLSTLARPLAVACLSIAALALFTGTTAADASPVKRASSGQQLPALQAGSVFAFLPAPTSGQAGAIKSDDAVHAISDYLKSHGFRLLPAGQVRSKLASHALEGCKEPTTCDPALALATLHADAVISTAMWKRPSGPVQLVVHVRRQQGYGQAEVNVNSPVGAQLRAAAVTALQQALEDSRQTHEINVLIESLPIGATVHVDQTLTGKTPVRFALLPGSHLVSVEASGFVTRAQYLELPEHGMTDTRLELTLSRPEAEAERQPPAAPAGPNRTSEATAAVSAQPVDLDLTEPRAESGARSPSDAGYPSATNVVIGAVLLGIAAPLIANAVYGAATNGKCVGPTDAQGHCSERVGLGPFFYLSAGLGGLAAIGGAAFLIIQPLQTHELSYTGAQLLLQQHF